MVPEDTVYRFKKYIYGLPDSGKAYYLAYAKLLQDAGYKKAKSDPFLFYKIIGVERIYIWIHVADTFVAATSEELLQEYQEPVQDVESYLSMYPKES